MVSEANSSALLCPPTPSCSANSHQWLMKKGTSRSPGRNLALRRKISRRKSSQDAGEGQAASGEDQAQTDGLDPEDPPPAGSDARGSAEHSQGGVAGSQVAGGPSAGAGINITNPVIRQMFADQGAMIESLTTQVQVLKALREVPAPVVPRSNKGFQGVKLRPYDPPPFSGNDNKLPIRRWLETVEDWLEAGRVEVDCQVGLAKTFLIHGASSF